MKYKYFYIKLNWPVSLSHTKEGFPFKCPNQMSIIYQRQETVALSKWLISNSNSWSKKLFDVKMKKNGFTFYPFYPHFWNKISQCLSSIQYWSLFIICSFLYQSSYYSYLIKVGLGLGEEANDSFALFNLCR